jgi:hypothetical protein
MAAANDTARRDGYVMIKGRSWRWQLIGGRLVVGSHDWHTSRGVDRDGCEFWRLERCGHVVWMRIVDRFGSVETRQGAA